MAGTCDPTDELITYLQLRLEADGLDYREAVMIEDLMALLGRLQSSSDNEETPQSVTSIGPSRLT